MLRWLGGLGLLLGGCDTAFGLSREAPDAPVCPTAVGHDEDGDEVDDGCDNCPGISNPGQEAIHDTDPVGDACDPNPFDPRHVLVEFHSFAEPTAPQAWSTISGVWRIEDEALITQGLVNSTTYVEDRARDFDDPIALELAVRVDSVPATGFSALHLFPNARADGAGGWRGDHCDIYQQVGDPDFLIGWHGAIAGAGGELVLQNGARYDVRLVLEPDSIRCEIKAPATASQNSFNDPNAAGHLVFGVQSMAVTIEYVAIYGTVTRLSRTGR